MNISCLKKLIYKLKTILSLKKIKRILGMLKTNKININMFIYKNISHE